MSTLHCEILEQPGTLERLLSTQRNAVGEIAKAIQSKKTRFIYLAARGTSENAARYANYLWGIMNGFPVALAAPSMFTYYNRPPQLQCAFVVGISQSGRSPDIVSVLLEAKRQGCGTLAITNAPDSPLAEAADFVLDIQAGKEVSVAATKTYNAQLMAIAMLSAAMKHDENRWDELNQVSDWIRNALSEEEDIKQKVKRFAAIDGCIVLGRGFSYATAYEWALKLKEVANVEAQSYSSADFMHGPIAMVDGRLPIFAVAPTGPVYDSMIDVLKELRDERAADIFTITDGENALKLAQTSVRLPGGIPEWLCPLVSIVPAQLFSYHLALAKGRDPSSPRGMRKVTETT